jgi:hypothetical protein
MRAALVSERGCGECAASSGGPEQGNCADGLGILRSVLAAGVREAVNHDKRSLGVQPVLWMRQPSDGSSACISAEHALTILQVLHGGGVDVLARGAADPFLILHAAAQVNTPPMVRWLLAEASASLEDKDDDAAACLQ